MSDEDNDQSSDSMDANDLSALSRLSPEELQALNQGQFELQGDRDKVDKYLLDGKTVGNRFDKFFNPKIRATNLFKDNSITQKKTQSKYKAVILCDQLGIRGKNFTDGLWTEIVSDTDIAAAGNGWLTDKIRTNQSKIERTVQTGTMSNQPNKQDGIFDKLTNTRK